MYVSLTLLLKNGAEHELVLLYTFEGDFAKTTAPPIVNRLLSMDNTPALDSDNFGIGSANFYRRDDISATAYFYLDKPSSNLPDIPSKELRLKDLQERVYYNIK